MSMGQGLDNDLGVKDLVPDTVTIRGRNDSDQVCHVFDKKTPLADSAIRQVKIIPPDSDKTTLGN